MSSDHIFTFYIFLIGIAAAYLGSFSSGGVSAISIGLMTLLGIPAPVAGVTFKLGKVGDTLGGLYHFHKGGHIPTRYILGGGIALMCGSFLGSYLIFAIPDRIIYLGCGISMILLSAISILKKSPTEKKVHISKTREYVGYVSYFFLSIVGNMFPAGSGVWYYFSNTLILKLTPIESKGIASILALFWFVGTVFGIMTRGAYHIDWAIALAVGMFIGGYYGTQHIISISSEKLERILLSTILIFAVYFLYKSFA